MAISVIFSRDWVEDNTHAMTSRREPAIIGLVRALEPLSKISNGVTLFVNQALIGIKRKAALRLAIATFMLASQLEQLSRIEQSLFPLAESYLISPSILISHSM